MRHSSLIRFGRNFTKGVYCRFDVFSKADERFGELFGEAVKVNDYVNIAAVEKFLLVEMF